MHNDLFTYVRLTVAVVTHRLSSKETQKLNAMVENPTDHDEDDYVTVMANCMRMRS